MASAIDFQMFYNMVPDVWYWFQIFAWSLLLIVLLVVGYFYLIYKYKYVEISLYGSGRENVYSIGKIKANKITALKKNTVWKPLWPLGNKQGLQPWPSHLIYPGNTVFGFNLDGVIIPGEITIGEDLMVTINPVPTYLRNWQSMMHKQHELEFASDDFWAQNKHLLMTLGVVIFNLCLCGFVVYMLFKYGVTGLQEASSVFKQTLSNWVPSGGAPPM